MLISQLMLNLRTFSNPDTITNKKTQSSAEQEYSGIHFATNSFLGNIGAPLDGGDHEEEEWDSDK
ncbi:hypothetical protein GYMLUDRAFT_393639 [Collybiopsis luxurians FD-317 M1]|uniref:Uncharacterized protein n=1 Tax=Collybiopsis luxurians FD-317 M1 TaxID=944289 RepID=A0A0D0BB61_9AGAR|nr:hypothetical protein GYMLUDRAFT_393639 [Collybiopsis luxurians FD-317 M1]